MIETNALTALRLATAKLDQDDKLAFAAFLALECTTQVSFSVFQEKEPFSQNLREAFETLTEFPRTAKLAFAIELLQYCQDEEESAAGIESEDDCGLDAYDYNTPALDEEEEDY